MIPPTGANTIWVNFDGRRWHAAKSSIEYDASVLNEIGSYQGWTVYAQEIRSGSHDDLHSRDAGTVGSLFVRT